MFQWVDIQKAPGGFGEWQSGMRGELFDTLDDLLVDTHCVELVDCAQLPAGAEDIRGRVQNEPDRIYVVAHEDGSVAYFGADYAEAQPAWAVCR